MTLPAVQQILRPSINQFVLTKDTLYLFLMSELLEILGENGTALYLLYLAIFYHRMDGSSIE